MLAETPPLYYNNDTDSFGYATARSRWPVILKTAVHDVQLKANEAHPLMKSQSVAIITAIENLLTQIETNGPVELFSQEDINLIPDLQCFNDTIAKSGPYTWLDGPWLFTECYLYRVLDLEIKKQSAWANWDVFERLKRNTFKSSSFGVEEIAGYYTKLSGELKTDNEIPLEKLKLLFEDFVDTSLWGNATDLSLLANATLEDIQSRQGSAARATSAKNILCNDIQLAWDRLLSVPFEERRVDFVLDNAGFEFYTDLALTLFLLDSKLVSQVVFHCKTRPWMVSDTMVKDYKLWVHDMKDPTFFTGSKHRKDLNYFVESIEKYHKQGKFNLVDSEFWTGSLDYWELSQEETKYGGAELWKYFQDSTLVIVKGDLNYRKLTGDRKWVRSTPFNIAINKLAGAGIHILALRTCKADVCAGLPEGKDEELCKLWESEGHDIGGLWCSSGKWAVVSYTDGKSL